jgi:hypothetical protein
VAETVAVKEVDSMIADPESMEYPIETAGTEPQVEVLATSLNGEVIVAPFAGVVTVMAAAGTHNATAARRAERKIFTEASSHVG